MRVEFKTRNGIARVIDDLHLSVMPGETLGVVGESGCGKSMTALSIMGLVPIPPGRIAAGKIMLDGEDLLQVSESRMREVRGNEISMIFQEPMTSLNPVYSVGNQIAETARLHEGLSARAARDRAVEMLHAVGIPAPEKRVDEFPSAFGGNAPARDDRNGPHPQAARIDRRRAHHRAGRHGAGSDLRPITDLQEQTGTAIILITHDMGAIAEMAQRAMVMYAGRKIEQASVDEILTNPKHPYTQGLIACVPHMTSNPTRTRWLQEIPGVVPADSAR